MNEVARIPSGRNRLALAQRRCSANKVLVTDNYYLLTINSSPLHILHAAYRDCIGSVNAFDVNGIVCKAQAECVGLAVFNVIPIPPLDGSKVVNALLPQRIYYKILRYEKYGFLIMIVVLYLGILNGPLNFCRNALLDGLTKISSFPFYILQSLFG